MGGGQNCPPSWFSHCSREMAMNKPPVFCNFSQNLSEHLESKCRPRWPTGSPDTRWILEGTQGGQNCPPCEISRFCLQNRCYRCWVIENNKLPQKIALAWFWGCNHAVMTSSWRHADILMFYHRNGQHTPFSTIDPSFLTYLRRRLRFLYFCSPPRLPTHFFVRKIVRFCQNSRYWTSADVSNFHDVINPPNFVKTYNKGNNNSLAKDWWVIHVNQISRSFFTSTLLTHVFLAEICRPAAEIMLM